MNSNGIQIIGKLPGNRILIARPQNTDDPESAKQKIIESLKKRDQEVRIHESSHGTNPELIKIGPAQFDYTIGPDGKPYATGGKITLSTGNPQTPEDALAKARALRQASMAPGEPSYKDFQALNSALAMEFEARNGIYTINKKTEKPGLSLLKGTNLNLYA